jgi:ATP-dependent Clp protease protease subunit
MDMEIHIKETLKLKRKLEDILAHHTGKTQKEISKATERDYFLSPEEAQEFGLIDHIVARAGDSE